MVPVSWMWALAFLAVVVIVVLCSLLRKAGDHVQAMGERWLEEANLRRCVEKEVRALEQVVVVQKARIRLLEDRQVQEAAAKKESG